MKRTVTSLMVGALLTASTSFAGNLDTDTQKTNYMIGADVGNYILKSGLEFDSDAFMQGITDAANGKDSQISPEVIAELRKKLQDEQRAAQEAQRKEMMAKLEADKVKNLEAGKAFMAKKAKESGIKSTDSGILYEVIEQGDGAKPASPSSTVKVHYTGTLIDGSKFDSSVDRGEPNVFALNPRSSIVGLQSNL